MRIYVIGRSLPGRDSLSVGLFELEQAKALSRRGHEVIYLFSDNRSLREHQRTGKRVSIEDGVYCLGSYFPVGFKLPVLYRMVKEVSMSGLFNGAERRFGKPDVVHIHYPLLTMTDGLWGKLREKYECVVVTEHWSRVQLQRLDDAQWILLERIYREADWFLPVGGLLKDSLEEMYGPSEHLEVVPNMVNTEDAPETAERRSGEYCFLYAGSFQPEKRVPMLIEAFETAFGDGGEARLLLVGDGPERRRAERLVRIHGMENCVEFLGKCGHSETLRRIRESDCVVSASGCETFGVPFAEGWMCGKPVIASRNTGIATYVNPGNGLLFETDRVESLSEAMKQMALRRLRYDALAIAGEARKWFSESSVCGRLERCYGVRNEKRY